MSFIPPVLCTTSQSPKWISRRRVLRFALAAVATISLSPISSLAKTRNWDLEDLCPDCGGRGKQTCSFCEGTGVFNVDDSFVDQSHVCPNCEGVGIVKCPSCIGLGLANTNGILRSAARDGSLRMLRNGSYEILDCSAFPACDVYGREKNGQP